jgi:hypothetical protein
MNLNEPEAKYIEESEDDEIQEVMFKVILEKPLPEAVKISKKNVCIVTIVKGEESGDESNQKLLEYYVAKQEKTFSS